jgi:hypothetical protein
MHIDLYQRRVTDAVEPVDLSGLDYQDVTGTGLEFLAVDGPEPSAFSHELDFVIRMAVRPGSSAGQRI